MISYFDDLYMKILIRHTPVLKSVMQKVVRFTSDGYFIREVPSAVHDGATRRITGAQQPTKPVAGPGTGRLTVVTVLRAAILPSCGLIILITFVVF